MPSHDKTGRSKKGGQFVQISYVMARCPAWRSLGGAAVKVFIELRSRFHGGNNGELSVSYREAAKLLRLSKSTVKRAFDELETKGFIKKTSPGHWYGRKAATWAVTDRKLNGYPATRDYQSWHKRNGTGKTEVGIQAERKHPLRPASVPRSFFCVSGEYSSGGIRKR